MIRNVVAAAMMLGAGEAAALSCMVPNLGWDFNRLVEVPDMYYVALGTLSTEDPVPDIPLLEQTEGVMDRTGIRFTYTFTGQFLGLGGLGRQVSEEVTVEVVCLSVWCGWFPPSDTEMIMFLREDEDESLSLEIGPCGGPLLPEPSVAQVAAIRRCMDAGTCAEAEMTVFER